MPMMQKKQADQFMKKIYIVLDSPVDDNIFKNNVNPLRVGLSLFKTIEDIKIHFGYSSYTC